LLEKRIFLKNKHLHFFPFLSQKKSLKLIVPLPSFLQIKLHYSQNVLEKVKHLPEQRKVEQHTFLFINKNMYI